MNRIIGSVPWMEKKLVYLAGLRELSGSRAAHLINSSALPDPRHKPIIHYIVIKSEPWQNTMHINVYATKIIIDKIFTFENFVR